MPRRLEFQPMPRRAHRRAAPARAAAVCLAAMAGCTAPTPTTSGPSAIVTADALEIRTGLFTVPAASESLTCFYTALVTDRELAINGATGVQGPGGHHVTLYYTEAVREPGWHPCSETEMASWKMVAGTGGEPGAGDDQSLPDGMAMRIPAGVQIVVQAHYINTSAQPMDVEDSLSAPVLSPAEVDAYAAMFVVHEDRFEVPARSAFESVSECVLGSELNIVLLMGHMHSAGRQFNLEIVREDGTVEPLYQHAWEGAFVSHPPVNRYEAAAPLVLPAGTRLRQTCQWNNTTEGPLLFPSEMCDGVMFFFPDDGAGMQVCTPETVNTRVL